MANTKNLSQTDVYTVRLDTTGTLNIGEAAEGAVGSWVLHISGTFSGSLVLRKKIRRGSVTDGNAPTTYYENFATGVSVAAGTALTAAALLKVPCDGCDLILDYTAASGVMVIECTPLLG
jgi:hypothetical protein